MDMNPGVLADATRYFCWKRGAVPPVDGWSGVGTGQRFAMALGTLVSMASGTASLHVLPAGVTKEYGHRCWTISLIPAIVASLSILHMEETGLWD